MDSSLFKSLVEVESREASVAAASPSDGFPPPPQKAVQRTYPGAPYRGDESIELQRLHTEHDATDIAEPLQSMWDPYMNRWRLLTACLMNLGNGLNDSAPGALIPYMEKHYNIGYAVVSLIFVGNALGFIFAAVFLDALRARMSRAHLLVFGQAILLAAYIPLIVGGPFPAIIVGFFFLGFAMSINLAMNNIFCGSLQNATTALGAMHGSYGIGGTVGPIIATAIATSGNPWYRFYLLPLSLAFGNLFFGWWSFAKFERDQPLTLQPTLSAAAPAANSQFLSMFYALRMRLVPNLVGAATSLAIVGLLLGPIYPCAAAVFMRGMSGKHRASGMVVISAFGSSGGAVAPFTTGLLAQAFGTWVLHPIALGLFVCMTACWFWLPTQRKRNE
ncbi:hypothetical protein BN1708_013875 [Verticillium longisporum]|uniref:Major facilitator superfamily (MFS) profile domain-containing protein n=1 Tax=Verticillium longisporum TaxID=100787 RepID=A0A0G4LRB0_VERLO|nr:hypothetical protein BN1708_013875 [Verticillium longisporum]